MDIVYYAIFGFVEDSLAFSPRNAIRSADYVVARRLSVMSICLSVTRRCYMETVKHILDFFHRRLYTPF